MISHSVLLNAFVFSVLCFLVLSPTPLRSVAESVLASLSLSVLTASPVPVPVSSGLPTTVSSATCSTNDQANPIASLYPYNVTGVLNITAAIVPIPLASARAVIPAQYPILEAAYRAAMPSFPEGMYPLLVQAGHDHDIHITGYNVSDFSRAGYEFPYVDLLGDGRPFRWAPEQLIDASNQLAVAGSRAYGTVVHPAAFDPPCDAYASAAGPVDTAYLLGASVPTPLADSDIGVSFMRLSFSPLPARASSPYPLAFYRALLNQPIFAGGTTCDSQTRLFNTRVSSGAFAPVAVVGDVVANIGPFAGPTAFHSVFGLRVATAFIENNYLDCRSAYDYLPA